MKKVLMGITGTAMMATTAINHVVPNSQVTSDTKTSEYNSTIQNTTIINDIKITTEGTVEKSNTSTTKNLSYIPETSVPAKGNIVTSGTTLKFNLNIILLGTRGKCQNIKNITASIDTKATYGLKNITPEEQKELNALIKSISTTVASVENPNSESTIHLEPEIHFSNTDWNVEVDPTLQIKVTLADGKTVINNIKLDKLLETNKYTNNVNLSSSLSKGASEGKYYINISGGCSTNDDNKVGIYNPANQKVNTITFKLHNSDSSQLKVTPLKVPGFTVNNNGTYTVTKALLDSNKQLFEVSTIGDKAIQGRISIEPISVDMTSNNSNLGKDYNIAYTNNYKGSSVYINKEAKTTFTMGIFSKSYQTKQNTYQSNWSGVKFETTMSNDIPGKYKIYTGSLVSNGEILVKSSNYSYNLINNKQVYCHLNSNIVAKLQSGTPAQKAEIMQKITSGDMTGIGISYTGLELSKLMSEGKTVPDLNFTYTEGNYTGRHTTIGSSYQTIPTEGNGNPVISRTITYGKLEGTYTDTEKESIAKSIANGQLESDGIIGTGSNYQGFILSPLNSYTDSYIKNHCYGTMETKNIRYENYSGGLSAAYNSAHILTGITAPGVGSVTENITDSKSYDWLLKPHPFILTIQGSSAGPALLTNNSTITVNMGHSFELVKGSNVTINGYITIPSSNVKIEGNKLIIKMTPAIAQAIGQAPTINFKAKYTNVENLPNSISIQAGISGDDNSDGMIYKYNNKTVSAQQGGMPSFSNYKTTIKFNYKNMNVGSHYILNTNGNTSTLGNTIINVGNYSKTYYIAGEIPQDGITGLAGNLYCPNAGGLSTEIESIDSNGAPLWVLPKSAMTLKNQELLTSATGMDLKNSLSYIESPSSGWVKYKPGMSLSNMVGYFAVPTVKAESAYSMTYKLKLTNINSSNSIPQAVNSAFKYFDATDKVGTVSSVVTMTPTNSNSEPSWFSNVNEVGGKLTTSDINKTVIYNDKKISLKDLIGSGYNEDNNWDNTPTKLMNEVTLANDQKALEALGYQLVNITVDGKVRDLSWFKNTGILNNTNALTQVTFNIKKIGAANTTVDVVNSKGDIIYSSSTSNKIGASIDDSVSKVVPEGYKVISVTVNGVEVSQDKVPKIQSKDNQKIIYTVSKKPKQVTDTVNVVCQGTDKLYNSITKTGDVGSKTGLSKPEIPEGYHIVSVTNSTKGVTGLPTIFGDQDNTTTYTIAKNVEDKTYVQIIIKGSNEQLPKMLIGESEPGKTNIIEIPELPTGYKVDSITVNGSPAKIIDGNKIEITNNISTSVEHDNNVVITVESIKTTDTVKVVYKDNNKVYSTISKTGTYGNNTNLTVPTIPENYHVVSIINSTKGINGLPKTFGSKDNTTTYIIAPNVKDEIYIGVKNEDGTVLVPSKKIDSGYSGTNTNFKLPIIPKGYHVVKVLLNGNKVSKSENGKYEFPAKYPSSTTIEKDYKVEVIVAKTPTTTVEEHYSDGSNVVSNIVTTNLQGTEVNTGLPKLPKGYQVTSITVNGKKVTQNDVPKIQSKDNQIIVYTIDKQPTYTVKVMAGNEQIGKIQTVTGDTGSDTKLIQPVIPDGYHITSITANEKTITTLPKKFGNSNEDIIYHVKPIVKPEENHNDVKPSVKSEENHNDVKPAVKPEENHNDIKPSVKPEENHNDIKPVVKPEENHNDVKPAVKPEENHNEVKHSNTNDTSSTKIQSLPDTGLNTNSNDKVKDIMDVAGILSVIGGILFFKRKK